MVKMYVLEAWDPHSGMIEIEEDKGHETVYIKLEDYKKLKEENKKLGDKVDDLEDEVRYLNSMAWCD